MLLLDLLIISCLLLVFIQDAFYRRVYVLVFPALVVLFAVAVYLAQRDIMQLLKTAAINLFFIALQLFLLWAYFSVRKKRRVNLTGELLGWGDILFLAAAAFYFSFLNFIFFYVVSLIGALVLWLVWLLLVTKKSRHVPLAGLQALIFILFFIYGRFAHGVDLMRDDWLLLLMVR